MWLHRRMAAFSFVFAFKQQSLPGCVWQLVTMRTAAPPALCDSCCWHACIASVLSARDQADVLGWFAACDLCLHAVGTV
jgi:hypothetical protein